MTKKLLLTLALIVTGFVAMAQSGQVWTTKTVQRFDINKSGEITKQYDQQDYAAHYIFLNNNQLLAVAKDVATIYKVSDKKVSDKYVDYVLKSDAGDKYNVRFSEVENYIIITSLDDGFSLYLGTEKPFTTSEFKKIGNY